VTTSENDMQI